MHLRFLCPAHRKLAEHSYAQALSVWQLSREKALQFMERGRLEQSIAAAGSALEVAELLLPVQQRATANEVTRFTESAGLLLNFMGELHQPELTRRLLGGCIARLEALIACGGDRRMILGCCQQLLQAGAQINEQPGDDLPRRGTASHRVASNGVLH